MPVGNMDLHKGINSSMRIQISLAGTPASTRSEAAEVEMESLTEKDTLTCREGTAESPTLWEENREKNVGGRGERGKETEKKNEVLTG